MFSRRSLWGGHAVAAAYGWDEGISEDEALRKLLGLNVAGAR